MVAEIERITGIDSETLKQSFQRVHRRHGTTEYAFAIQELDVLHDVDRSLTVRERLAKYDSAIQAFRSTRKRTLKLFPGVRATLEQLARDGLPVVALSDSMTSYVSRRLRQLDVDTLLAAVCAPRDHGLPPGLAPEVVRKARSEDILARLPHIEFPATLRKPDHLILKPILDSFGVEPETTILVGDSLSRDVLMARRGGLVDVWARYGKRNQEEHYAELVKITYWTEEDIRLEERLRNEIAGAEPTHTIDSFSEVLKLALHQASTQHCDSGAGSH